MVKNIFLYRFKNLSLRLTQLHDCIYLNERFLNLYKHIFLPFRFFLIDVIKPMEFLRRPSTVPNIFLKMTPSIRDLIQKNNFGITISQKIFGFCKSV